MLQAQLRDTDDLVDLLRAIGATPEVSDTRTILVLDSIKESLGLPMDKMQTREPGSRRKRPGKHT
jgi:hypothetical protein